MYFLRIRLTRQDESLSLFTPTNTWLLASDNFLGSENKWHEQNKAQVYDGNVKIIYFKTLSI
jgi:hypothetical protein